MNMKNNGEKRNPITESFSSNGRIIIPPFRTDKNESGNDTLTINYYRISCLMTYSIQAQIQKRIYCKWPHPQDGLFESIWECKQDAKNCLQAFCDQNKLKKAFNRLVPSITEQLDLFEEI